MFERIIEAEEYQDGYYRERATPRGRRARPNADQPTEQLEFYTDALFNTAKYDCLAVVAVIGLVVRLFMLICYFLTRHVVEYDISISAWGLVGKLFWIWLDIKLVRGWRQWMRPICLAYSRQIKKRPIAIGIIALAGGIAGLMLYQAIFEGRLRQFFLVNKLMVMGSMGVSLLLLFYYILRIASIISKLEDDELLPSALEAMFRHN